MNQQIKKDIEEEIESLKKALQSVIRNHKSFEKAEKCKYCKERVELIKNFAWN